MFLPALQKTDTVTPLEVALTGTNNTAVELAFTHGLPSVAYGTDFRGNLTENGYGGPDLLLEHYQQILNLSLKEGTNGSSETVERLAIIGKLVAFENE